MFLIILGLLSLGFIIFTFYPSYVKAHSTAEEWLAYVYGPRNPALICPHCQTPGLVHTKATTRKAGISGGKAAAALLTGGVSVLATGLSQNQAATQAHCGNCASDWTF